MKRAMLIVLAVAGLLLLLGALCGGCYEMGGWGR